MVPLVTAAEMRALDKMAIEEVGIPSLVLMESAGRAASMGIQEHFGPEASVLIVAGTGNNGGDGVVIARDLVNSGHRVLLVLLGEPEQCSPDAQTQLEIAKKLDIEPVLMGAEEVDELLGLLIPEFDVIVDAIFGTGLSRPIQGAPASAIEVINHASVPVVAIDIPSGVDATTGQIWGSAIEADITYSFCLPKLGLMLHPGRGYAGEIEARDIGIPYALLESIEPQAELLDPMIAEAFFAPRDPRSHKGSYGHLMVVAGTPDKPGSALLASRAALRVGTGLVTLGSDDETVRRLAPALEALMGKGLGASLSAKSILDALPRMSALCIGPSLVPDDVMRAWLGEVLEATDLPVVLDAGALDALGDPGWLKVRSGPTVLTPHPGEMGRLMGSSAAAVQSDRVGSARALAEQTASIVVLKGASTLVVEPDGRISVLARGNAGMATGGMGDVLTGVIGGLLAQGFEAAEAARLGVYLHSLAGDSARDIEGEARLTAGDVIEQLARPPAQGET